MHTGTDHFNIFNWPLTQGWLKFTKGHNSIKTADGVMVLNLCTSSDDALYLFQVSRKYRYFTGF